MCPELNRENPTEQRLIITGNVGYDLSGVIVVAYENYNGIMTAIGFDELDRSWGYHINCSPDQIRNPDKKNPCLVIRAYKAIAETAMDNATWDANIDISIPHDAQ